MSSRASRRSGRRSKTSRPVPGIRLGHPYFTRPTPCTMLIDEVEAIWEPIANGDEWSAFNSKLAAIREMAEAYGANPSA